MRDEHVDSVSLHTHMYMYTLTHIHVHVHVHTCALVRRFSRMYDLCGAHFGSPQLQISLPE